MYPNYMALLMLLLYLSPVCAQDSSLIKDNQRLDSVIQHLPTKYLDQTSGKARRMQERVDQYSLRTLNRLQKQETRMRAKLAKMDSVAANNIFNHSIDSIGALNAKLKRKVSGFSPSGLGTGYLDTLQNSLSFLSNAKGIAGQSKAMQDKLSGSLKNVQDLQARFQQADQIKAYIRERRQQLKEQLAQYTGFGDDLKKYNKEAYYYGPNSSLEKLIDLNKKMFPNALKKP